ncbi:MAG: ribosomal protein S18-alanine N-acetyltransferase [Chloroflexota bacterium]|nr:ribosomal protein S18-alanine N-acetyltransferase [Chloroflexota bacterium]
MRTLLRTRLRPMSADDIAQVADIERESFPAMWPQTAYRRELTNQIARYVVITELRDDARRQEPQQHAGLFGALRRIVSSDAPPAPEHLLGFIGIWLMVGEAHIVTVAVRQDYRRMGIGGRLLIAAIEQASAYDQELVTLEVRASNDAAQRMYEKYGFMRAGVRKRYYTDNNEDAVIMTTPEIASPTYRALLGQLGDEHRAEHGDLWA